MKVSDGRTITCWRYLLSTTLCHEKIRGLLWVRSPHRFRALNLWLFDSLGEGAPEVPERATGVAYIVTSSISGECLVWKVVEWADMSPRPPEVRMHVRAHLANAPWLQRAWIALANDSIQRCHMRSYLLRDVSAFVFSRFER
jgi:hypothetical protein